MKSFFRIAMVCMSVSLCMSCQKDIVVESSIESNQLKSEEEFASILSKALYENVDLRQFIHDEALKQFDKDYDVFYPWTKDKLVNNKDSFRDILVDCSSETAISSIEKEMPLLNILVPDWGWFGAFSVNSWNVEDNDIVVSSGSSTTGHRLYHNGVFLGDLEHGLFPEYPVIIIKNNERMRISPETKSTSIRYEFADDNYNPGIETKGREIVTSYIFPSTSPGSNFVDLSSFSARCPESIAAWNEYGFDSYGAQRNYIYYNIPKGQSQGMAQNPKIRECVMAIRLNNMNCMERGDSKDPKLNEITKKDSEYPTTEDIVNAIWSDGQLEIQLYATTVKDGNVVVLNTNAIPVSGKDIFDISKIQVDFYHKTWFANRKYVYIPDQDNLTPKWYYLPTPLSFNMWNPTESSSIIHIHAYEIDESIPKTVTDTIKIKKGISASSKLGDKLGFDFDFGSTETTTQYTYTINQGSDDLGETQINFNDYVVRSISGNQCELQYYSTAQLDFIIVPAK